MSNINILEFPLQFQRQFSGPLDKDTVFATTAARLAYLTNARRYPGQPVVDLEEEQLYFINANTDGYVPIGDGSNTLYKDVNTYADMVALDTDTLQDGHKILVWDASGDTVNEVSGWTFYNYNKAQDKFEYLGDGTATADTFNGNRAIKRIPTVGLNVGTTGSTADFLNAVFFPYLAAIVTMDAIPTQEVGFVYDFNVTGIITFNDTEQVISRRLLKNGGQVATFTTTSYSLPQSANATSVFSVEVITQGDGRQHTATAERTVTFDTKHYYGPYGAVPTAAQARNLAGSGFRTANTGLLNTGTAETRFYVLVAPGRRISSVVDQDALNMDITADYVLVDSNATVHDAGGNPVTGYKMYEKVQTVPYSENHRHNITIING